MRKYIIYSILCLPLLGMAKDRLPGFNLNVSCFFEDTDNKTLEYLGEVNHDNDDKTNNDENANLIVPRPTLQSIVNECGRTKLVRNDPPAGITWYWNSIRFPFQPGSLSVAKSVYRHSGTTYYLIAQNNSTKQWSQALEINYTIKYKPATPDAPARSDNCGRTTLTRGNPPSGITWYWQSTESGASTANSVQSITRTSGNRYYLRARNNSNGCWSTTRTVSYSIKSKPDKPTVLITNNCGSTTLKQGIHVLDLETWYWQTSATGTSTSNSAQSITRTSGTRYYLRAKSNSNGCWSDALTINYTVKTIPTVPTATVANNCGNSKLTRNNPPNGITWYWQSSSGGTSTSNSAKTITRTSGSTYYLRARNNTSGCWSGVRTLNYSIKALPAMPSASSVVNNCGNSRLTRNNPPSGITWYWQSTSGGTNTANASTTLTVTSGSTYYLRARNNSTGCWSSARTVNYSIKSVPAKPTLSSVINQCGRTVITRNDPPSGVTWYWQSNPTIPEPTGSVAKTVTKSSGNVYYLRAKNNTTGCWSAVLTINYSIKYKPAMPNAPSVSNNCGSSTLTRGTPPSGVTWYWQSSESGASTAYSATSVTRTSGSRYYLRARDNTTGCWSTTRTVSYSIKTIPSKPTVLITNNCGSTTLKQGLHVLDLETWYWQTSATGTSTENSAQSITRTSGTTYYLRAKRNSSGCWSDVLTINYTIKALPAVPTASVVNNCGNSKLTRNNPPSGITWYWQNSSTGTSTSNSTATVTRTSGNTYYLRARNNTTGCWSSARTINYSIKVVPTVPSAPSVVNNCGNSRLTRSNPPSGITWYWLSTSDGTNTANSSSSITLTSGSTYYLRARNNSTGCWSSPRTVNYSIKSVPAKPTLSSVNNLCGRTVISRNDPPSGVTWYWQSNPVIPEPTGSVAKTVTKTSGDVYYLRAKNNTTGCWSETLTINYSIKAVPGVPAAPLVTNNCGSSTLTRTTPPSGITWYWQDTETGTSTANSENTVTRTSGSTYYLRARDNTTGCWSSARTFGYSIKEVPNKPHLAYITNNCGNTVLAQGLHVLDISTWYWQTTATGTSTENSSQTLTLTNGNTHYLRAKSTSSGCWSETLTINYTVNIIPSTPPLPNIQENCGNTVLTRTNPPAGISWYWQSDASGVSTANSLASITQNSTGTHYLRGLSIGGCWGDARRIDYTVIQPTPWYGDTDQDGFGHPADMQMDCTQPTGYVSNNNDRCPAEYGEKQGCVYASYDEVVFSNENYIFTQSFQKPVTSTQQIQYNKDVIESITYFDGIGRPMQQNAIRASKDEKDITVHIAYDEYGRQGKEYLPFEYDKAYGSYQAVDVENQINGYYKNTYPEDFPGITDLNEINAYSESIFEPSPLNRVLKQGAPGKSWKADPNSNADHTIKLDWKTNTAGEVAHFYVTFENNDIEKPQLVKSTTDYVAGRLYVTITKDENWQSSQAHPNDHTTKEYKDKLGRVVLKRAYNENIAHDTYYVYDDFGNLTYVIPPKVTIADGVSNNELTELCYQYRYDYRNRLIEKKIPGKGDASTWESIVYNRVDQPILTQDPNQKANNEWLFTKYDVFGRVAYTGKITDNRDRKTIQDEAIAHNGAHWVKRSLARNIGGTTVYYTKNGYVNVDNSEVLTISYYDDYEVSLWGLSAPPVTIFGQEVSTQTKSLPTISLVKVLGTDQWIKSATWYDKKGRPIYAASKNWYLNTTDVVETKLDFVGKVFETKTTHTKDSNAPIVTVDKFEYDHMGRVLSQTQKINNQDNEQIAANVYDELGQLISKKVGGTVIANASEAISPLQTVNYKYNVRGWLKGINDITTLGNDLFAFGIDYNAGTIPLYNGNISKTTWQTANDNVTRSYDYTYDALNRITSGLSNDGNYDLSNVSYDKMGNIMSLTRNGFQNVSIYTNMDILDYDYDDGNKLLTVIDDGNATFGFKDGTNTNDDFDYDANGNMTIDRNKGITGITYNHLNLPTTVAISNTEGTGTISYIYDATGAKLKKIVTEGSSVTTEYAGNYVYKNGNLEFFNHPEGIVEKEADGYKYVYHFKDHLDNVRLSYSDKNMDGAITQSEIVQEKNYYPFGLTHKGYTDILRGRNHTYGFGNKEEQDELGLGWIDITARNYDPALGRWTNLDPLAEQMRRHSPYNYAFDSPIYFIDPDGMAPLGFEEGPIKDKNGKIVAYEVEAGQGPSQIAEDLNSTGEFNVEANYFDIVESNPTKFSNVENLSDINDSGFKELNLNEGDIVSIDKVLDKESVAQENISERRELAGDINDTRKSIDKANKDIDSLVKVKETAINRNTQNKSAKAYESHPGDPIYAGALSEIGNSLRHGIIEMNSDNMVKKKKRDVDSMKALNNQRLNRMKEIDN
ncbi:DUF6443 domain-containing protein [Aquimarina sp. 2304DJ70-9]|uniref:DUF6443 domain-containing protein n=1 Tax=Aquimarina penaris TaxID=3231044 RepID=UPI0034620572